MIMGLESSGMKITADAVKVKLLQEVQSIGETNKMEETAFYSKSKGTNKKETVKIRRCYNCDKPGHLAAKCRSNTRKISEKQKTTPKAFMARISTENINSPVWYLDSCASTHMTGTKDILECVSTVKLANNQELVARGDVTVKVCFDGKTEKIRVHDVLYVPELAANLLSVSQIISKGYLITFSKGECIIKDSKRVTAAKGYLQGGIYRLSTTEQRALATIATEKSLWTNGPFESSQYAVIEIEACYRTW